MDVLIKLSDTPGNLEFPVEIKHMHGDITEKEFYMKLEDLVAELSNAISNKTKAIVETPILPKECVKHVWLDYSGAVQQVTIDVSKAQHTIHYNNKKLTDVGFPRLLFTYQISHEVCQLTNIVAVKGVGRMKPSTPLYHFPYSHVSLNGDVCMGTNTFPVTKEITALATYHSLFFNAPFGSDYGAKSTTGMPINKLFDQAENQPFNEEWLLPINQTFQEYFHYKK